MIYFLFFIKKKIKTYFIYLFTKPTIRKIRKCKYKGAILHFSLSFMY